MRFPLLLLLVALLWLPSADSLADQTLADVPGEVLEATDAGAYTYLRLKTGQGEQWAAVGRTPVKSGELVVIQAPIVMQDFESKSLKRTFATVLFGNLARADVPHDTTHGYAADNAESGAVAAGETLEKASGPGAFSVEEIVRQRLELNNTTVQLRAKVVKYTQQVMGRNWLHVRDGSGSASDETNDVLVTTQAQLKTGDVVLLSGTVRADKDFGSGYTYRVIIEDALIR